MDIFTLIPQDKMLHIFAGGMIFAIMAHHQSILVSYAVTLIIAMAKELYDALHPAHNADVWDVVTTMIGAVISHAFII